MEVFLLLCFSVSVCMSVLLNICRLGCLSVGPYYYCLFRITSIFLIGGMNESFKESLAFELIDLNHDDDLEFYDKQSIRKSSSISAALLRRIEYNTSRMIATTDFM